MRWFPSALDSPLTPVKKADLLGSPPQTSADFRTGLPTKPSLFRADYFPLISHPCEMGAYERAQFMVHRASLFFSSFGGKKKTATMEALACVP